MSYSHYPPSSHYPNYPPASYPRPYTTAPATPGIAGTPTGYPAYSQYPGYRLPQVPPPQPIPSKSVDIPSVNAELASKAIRRLIVHQLSAAGFSGASPLALERLEQETVAYLEQIYKDAQGYANLCNRLSPTADELLAVCEDHGMTAKDLRRVAHKSAKKKKRALSLGARTERTPSPELLGSDDEGIGPQIPPTLRYLPSHFPALPPKHTYLRTPITQPSKKAIPSLEKKLANASLVQESLKSLILATEDANGPVDADLIGHVVNWETATSARKRWRIYSR
ncbi:hypothetical protein SISSUDRAFT_1053840 [Sistotremastrum suecicum HHB10207 ss-3]|uniref:Transcription initiation factor TFIID subunit 8 n=1 Tax=Sistotremastrum suecicum HHB10207 ss-3 TaxID=1314776 RepID=A0A165YXX2_9AGAM|nr:hypothetical protein SISSUDRAFT_1053840 [Sistotremastrum suecicum HHB10207 ss-3]